MYNGDHHFRYFEVYSSPGRGWRTSTTSDSESVIVVQAEVLTEAFNVNLDALVTKDYLAARFAEQDAKINANFRIQLWMIGIVQAFVIMPYLERLL